MRHNSWNGTPPKYSSGPCWAAPPRALLTPTQRFGVWCCRNELRVQNCSSKPSLQPSLLRTWICVRGGRFWDGSQHRTLPWCWDLSLGSQGAAGPAQAAAKQFCVLGQFRVNLWLKELHAALPGKLSKSHKWKNLTIQPWVSISLKLLHTHTCHCPTCWHNKHIFLQKQLQRLTCDSPQPHTHSSGLSSIPITQPN